MEPEDLVAAAQAGDLDARDQVGEWLFVMLRSYLARWGFPPDQVADLRQQACVVVFEHLHEFEDRGPDSFARWTREIARRRAKKRWQFRAREAVNLDRLAHQPHDSTLSLTTKVTMLELEQLLEECADVVSQDEREAILWDFEEWDDHELARRRKVAVETIRTRRHRGYQRLASCMKEARRTPLPRLLREGSSSSQSR